MNSDGGVTGIASPMDLLREKDREIHELEKTVRDLSTLVQGQARVLSEIQASYGWRAVRTLFRMYDRAFPPRSSLRTFSGVLFRSMLRLKKPFNGRVSQALPDEGAAGSGQLSGKTRLYLRFLEATRPSHATLLWMRKASEGLAAKPLVSLIVDATRNDEALSRTIASLLRQGYPFFEIVFITADGRPPSSVISSFQKQFDQKGIEVSAIAVNGDTGAGIRGQWVCFPGRGTVLFPHALFELVLSANINSDADFIYCDEDVPSETERTHFLKPAWSPDLLLSCDYIGDAFMVRRSLLEKSTPSLEQVVRAGTYDLVLRATESAGNIVHTPQILFSTERMGRDQTGASEGSLADALKRRGIKGEAISLPRRGAYRVKRAISGNPTVSVIIPTAYRNPQMVKRCIASIVETSSYENFEIILIDNSRGALYREDGSRLAPEGVRLRVLTYDDPFNYSRMNNLAADRAEGDYLVFLNDDTEVIKKDWIQAMLEHAQRPEVGAVGAKLLYEDGRIQHAGVFLHDNGWGARHAFRLVRNGDDGYWGLAGVIRNCSAVTFGCAMVRRETFRRLGGLDEHLTVEYNDVDYCLRACREGYLVVWTPFALLHHKELTTRGYPRDDADRLFLLERWKHVIRRGDPFYSPLLTLGGDDYAFRKRPVLIEHCEPDFMDKEREKRNSLRRFLSKSTREILVIQLGGISEIVLSLPAVLLLKRRFPAAHINMLVPEGLRAIAERSPEVDRVLSLNVSPGNSDECQRRFSEEDVDQLGTEVMGQKVDLAIDLGKNGETREVLNRLDARITAGFRLASGLPAPTISYPCADRRASDIAARRVDPHISTQLCNLIQSIPSKRPSALTSGGGQIPAIVLKKGGQEPAGYDRFEEAAFLVGLHPFASNPMREWPSSHYADLADLLIKEHDAHVVVFGSQTENAMGKDVLNKLTHKGAVTSVVGETTVSELMAAISRCDVFIGNLSGPCYLAGALGVPTVMIFPGDVSPREWHPVGKHTLTVRVKMRCAPCYRKTREDCPNSMKCLKLLWPEKVYEAVLKVMAISGTPIPKPWNPRSVSAESPRLE